MSVTHLFESWEVNLCSSRTCFVPFPLQGVLIRPGEKNPAAPGGKEAAWSVGTGGQERKDLHGHVGLPAGAVMDREKGDPGAAARPCAWTWLPRRLSDRVLARKATEMLPRAKDPRCPWT